jgi:hypothetical protein
LLLRDAKCLYDNSLDKLYYISNNDSAIKVGEMLKPHPALIDSLYHFGGGQNPPLFFMQIKIRIPRFIEQLWARWGNWANVPVYTFANGREILRLDILLVCFGILIAIYYWTVYSWMQALMGVAFYIMVLMMALWLF